MRIDSDFISHEIYHHCKNPYITLSDRVTTDRSKLILEYNNHHPVVDFTQKEDEYVFSYIDELFQKRPYINLNTRFMNLRYGNSLEFMNRYKNPNNYAIYVGILDTTELQKNRLIIRLYTTVQDWLVLINYYFVGTKCFHFNKKPVYQTIDVISNPSSKLPDDIDPIIMNHPTIQDAENVWKWFIMLHILIQDHPERTMIVREESYNVLKPVFEAKKYIAETKETGLRRESQYTATSWTRNGFWRKNRNGKKQWIETTVCHRRKPVIED